MAIKLSTGCVNDLMGKQAVLVGFKSGATLAYADNGGSPDSITDSGNGLITSGFAPNQLIWTKNPTTGGNALSGVSLISVAAGTMTFVTGTLAQSEAFPAAGCVMSFRGGSIRDIFKDGVLRIFAGTAPSTADAATTGTLLCQLTLSSGAFVAGAFDNGLEFSAATAGVIGILSGETWSGLNLATGVATHFRLVGNAADNNGSSTSLQRIQGTVGTSGTDITTANTTLTVDETTTCSTFTLTYAPT